VTELAREYGSGLYALTEEEKISPAVLEEMQLLCQCFRAQPDFLRLLSNMSLSKEERVGILDHAFRGQVHPYLLNFLKILCERGALGEIYGCEEAFRALYYQDYGVVEAHVTTGVPLNEDQRARMIEKLGAMSGKKIALIEKVDPKVIGGVLLEMNGQRYDDTIRHRLQKIHQAMTGEG